MGLVAEGSLRIVPTSLPRSAAVIRNSGGAPATRVAKFHSLWVWWHLLSLDAPTVAVVWCWFFGAVFGLHFFWPVFPVMALGTWCVYVADRLLDGWRSPDMATLRDRHWFYLRHRRLFLIAWAAAAVPLAYLIFFRMQAAVRTDDIVLCVIGVAYFLLIHGSSTHSNGARRFPKELAVGFLFAIATAVPAWARLHTDRGLLIAGVLTFGTACWLNCVAIQTWEDAECSNEVVHAILAGGDSRSDRTAACDMTEFLGAHLTAFAAIVALLGAGVGIAVAGSRTWPLFAAVAVSAVLFLALVRNSRRFSALALRIFADAALLTPLLFLFRVR